MGPRAGISSLEPDPPSPARCQRGAVSVPPGIRALTPSYFLRPCFFFCLSDPSQNAGLWTLKPVGMVQLRLGVPPGRFSQGRGGFVCCVCACMPRKDPFLPPGPGQGLWLSLACGRPRSGPCPACSGPAPRFPGSAPLTLSLPLLFANNPERACLGCSAKPPPALTKVTVRKHPPHPGLALPAPPAPLPPAPAATAACCVALVPRGRRGANTRGLHPPAGLPLK